MTLRNVMLHLNQPYIEWSDHILATRYTPIDYQHQWLLMVINISLLLELVVSTFIPRHYSHSVRKPGPVPSLGYDRYPIQLRKNQFHRRGIHLPR